MGGHGRTDTEAGSAEGSSGQRLPSAVMADASYGALLEAAPDAMVIVDANGSIVLVNAQAERMFGYPRGELLNQPVELLMPERFRGDHPQRRAAYSQDPRFRPMGASQELYVLRKDGTELPVEISLSPLETPEGALVSAAIRDISDRREHYRRMQEANRLKSEFLANMSHELRTPLNAIIGFSELLYDGKLGDLQSSHREYVGDILSSAQHLLQLINDVLDLSKIEAGKMSFRPEPVDLLRLVNEVCDVVRSLLAEKQTRLRIDVDASIGDVVADPGKLKQVLYNYLSNAIKFTGVGGQVELRVVPEGKQYFRITVQDDGVGIHADDLSRLFQEFQQLDAGLSKRFQGTGLGLALTRKLVEAQGGSVGVDSEVGAGSSFFAVLPRQPVSTADLIPLEPPMLSGSGERTVLVVEDDNGDRSRLTTVLVAAGFAVESVSTGGQALACIARRAYAAITLDVLLPDMNGWDVLRVIRSGGLNIATPVIVVSVIADPSNTAAFQVDGCLSKPVDAERLISALCKLSVSAGAPGPGQGDSSA